MPTLVTNRAEVRKDFFKLTAGSSTDKALSEFDTATGDAVNRYIQYGLWELQSWYLSNVDPHLWIKTSGTISVTDASATLGYKHADLPGDFLRLYGDEDVSALKRPNGIRWGQQIPHELRAARGQYFYIADTHQSGDSVAVDRLLFTRGSTPPSDLVMEYNYRVAELTTDAQVIDFPTIDRPLIHVYAAWLAMDDAWLPGGDEMRARIENKKDRLERRAYARGRRTREPRKVRGGRTLGSKWMVS